jgi:polar amino acid transport system substrate-binding protein
MVKWGVFTVAMLASVGVAMATPAPAGHVAPAPPATLYLTTEFSPPGSMVQGGRVVGYTVDKVREIMARAGIAHTLELQPWKRAYTQAIKRPDGCVFSTTRTVDRETLFKWVGPLDEGEWVLLGRADRPMQITSLEDVRGLRIGTYHGDARDEYLRARGFRVDPAQNDMINPQKLLLNRIDLWAAGFRRGNQVLQKHGWADRIVPVFTFARVKLYLACNRGVPDGLVEKMQHALDAMERDGTSRRLEQLYDGAAGKRP